MVSRSPDPLALVVVLHGYRSDGGAMLKQWTPLLNAGFALLLPEGARGGSKFRSWNARVCWCVSSRGVFFTDAVQR